MAFEVSENLCTNITVGQQRSAVYEDDDRIDKTNVSTARLGLMVCSLDQFIRCRRHYSYVSQANSNIRLEQFRNGAKQFHLR